MNQQICTWREPCDIHFGNLLEALETSEQGSILADLLRKARNGHSIYLKNPSVEWFNIDHGARLARAQLQIKTLPGGTVVLDLELNQDGLSGSLLAPEIVGSSNTYFADVHDCLGHLGDVVADEIVKSTPVSQADLFMPDKLHRSRDLLDFDGMVRNHLEGRFMEKADQTRIDMMKVLDRVNAVFSALKHGMDDLPDHVRFLPPVIDLYPGERFWTEHHSILIETAGKTPDEIKGTWSCEPVDPYDPKTAWKIIGRGSEGNSDGWPVVLRIAASEKVMLRELDFMFKQRIENHRLSLAQDFSSPRP